MADTWYHDPEKLQAAVDTYGSLRRAAEAMGCADSTLVKWARRHGIDQSHRRNQHTRPALSDADQDALEHSVYSALKRGPLPITQLADTLDVAPRRVRDAITRLGDRGYRVDVDDDAGDVRLEKVAPAATGLHRDLLPLIDGDTLRVGVVSDTHGSSKEEALDELHAAYDHFAREGITTVLHAGDWVTGLGIFPGQHAEIKEHTADDQVAALVRDYPQRDGIQTIGIAGNHDLEGQNGRLGFDPVRAFSNQREDVTYLGGMSAWLQVGGDDGPWVHLLHGKGGMSYAYSYKAQKLVDGYPAGRKPNMLIVGHWHVQASLRARGVHVLFPGCFEWQSPFMQRLGLTPAVGFHVLTVTYGDDGSIVRYLPEWVEFHPGRTVGR